MVVDVTSVVTGFQDEIGIVWAGLHTIEPFHNTTGRSSLCTRTRTHNNQRCDEQTQNEILRGRVSDLDSRMMVLLSGVEMRFTRA